MSEGKINNSYAYASLGRFLRILGRGEELGFVIDVVLGPLETLTVPHPAPCACDWTPTDVV